MRFQKLREALAAHFNKEKLKVVAGYAKRKALGFLGSEILKRKRKGVRMKKFTLRLSIDVETTGRDVIDKAMSDASPNLYKYAPEALAFLNLDGSSKFCGFKSDVQTVKTKRRDTMKPFKIQVDLFLEAEGKKAIQDPVESMRDQFGNYAAVVLGVLGVAEKVQFKGMDAEVLKGHA